MVEPVSTLGNALLFLKSFGFYDVILPFLLTFTIVFGVLEKTKIFGIEKIGSQDLPRRNLNALIAFAVAFFVVAAFNVVAAIQQALPQIVLVLIILLSFLMLFGILGKDEALDVWSKFPTASKIFIVFIFVVIIGIFLNAFGVLGGLINLILGYGGGILFNVIIFLLIFGAIIYFVVKRPTEEKSK